MLRFISRCALPALGALCMAMVPLAQAAERSLDKEVVVAATVEQVWAAWTTSAGLMSFMAPEAEVQLRVGGAFHVHFDPLAEPGSKGADDMRIMGIQPMKMLSFDWNAPPSLPEARQQRTFVVVRFEPVSDKETKVRIHHTGWGDGGEWDKTHLYFDRAWGVVLGNLKKRFDTGPIDWTDWMNSLRKMHAAPAPKS